MSYGLEQSRALISSQTTMKVCGGVARCVALGALCATAPLTFIADNAGNFMCIYQPCTNPIRSENRQEYRRHLNDHVSKGHTMVVSMVKECIGQ